jgi:hypothetical protein
MDSAPFFFYFNSSVNTLRSIQQRVKKYAEGLNPLVIYLYVKKQRNQGDMIIGVQTLKDMDINPILTPYNLDARKNILALFAWRELYWMGFKAHQKVKLNE